MMKRIGVVLIVLAIATNAFAVTLAWDAVTSTPVNGYRLYYGLGSGSYSTVLDAGVSTSASVSGLQAGTTYYFAATAYTTVDESVFSNEVSYVVPVADVTSPTVNITSPADGSTVQRRSWVTIEATASDDVGVTRVEFYVNGALQCSTVDVPYACQWHVPNQRGRMYLLTANAFDAAGNVGNSNSVWVTSH
jgi:chitinase